jgi:hypothetical protein
MLMNCIIMTEYRDLDVKTSNVQPIETLKLKTDIHSMLAMNASMFEMLQPQID